MRAVKHQQQRVVRSLLRSSVLQQLPASASEQRELCSATAGQRSQQQNGKQLPERLLSHEFLEESFCRRETVI